MYSFTRSEHLSAVHYSQKQKRVEIHMPSGKCSRAATYRIAPPPFSPSRQHLTWNREFLIAAAFWTNRACFLILSNFISGVPGGVICFDPLSWWNVRLLQMQSMRRSRRWYSNRTSAGWGRANAKKTKGQNVTPLKTDFRTYAVSPWYTYSCQRLSFICPHLLCCLAIISMLPFLWYCVLLQRQAIRIFVWQADDNFSNDEGAGPRANHCTCSFFVLALNQNSCSSLPTTKLRFPVLSDVNGFKARTN